VLTTAVYKARCLRRPSAGRLVSLLSRRAVIVFFAPFLWPAWNAVKVGVKLVCQKRYGLLFRRQQVQTLVEKPFLEF